MLQRYRPQSHRPAQIFLWLHLHVWRLGSNTFLVYETPLLLLYSWLIVMLLGVERSFSTMGFVSKVDWCYYKSPHLWRMRGLLYDPTVLSHRTLRVQLVFTMQVGMIISNILYPNISLLRSPNHCESVLIINPWQAWATYSFVLRHKAGLSTQASAVIGILRDAMFATTHAVFPVAKVVYS